MRVEKASSRSDMPLSCSLPRGFLISTDNSDPDFYYLSSPSGEIIDKGEDVNALFELAWREYRKGKNAKDDL